jgi:hypothetical protein
MLSQRHVDGFVTMLRINFSNAFNLVDKLTLLREVRLKFSSISLLVEFLYGQTARLYFGDLLGLPLECNKVTC